MSTKNYLDVIHNNHHLRRQAEDAGAPDTGFDKPRLPGWLIDKIAEEKFNQGWTPQQLSRSNLCDRCHEFKAANGSCSCE